MPDIDYQKIVLNLIPKREDDPVVFYASQYETARPFKADLMWGDTEFAPGDDHWAEIDIRKNDDNLVVITEDVAIDNNEVSVILPVQAVTCIGKNLGQIKIYAGEDQFVAAFNFILEVQPDPLAGGVTSDTAIDNLTQQIEDIAEEVIGEDYYDKTEVDTLLNGKADAATTYTKTEVDNALALKANSSDLATVATTGDYDDLINKPIIPAAQIQSDYAQADNTQVDYIKNKPDIAGMITAAIDNILPVVSASGPIATINVGLERALKTITVDPLATLVVRCGMNFTTASDTTTSEAGYIVGAGFPEYINTNERAIPSGTFTVSFTTANASYPCAAQIVFYDSNTAVGTNVININSAGRVSISITATANFDRWQIFCNSGIGGTFTDFQLEAGSTVHDYATYNSNIYDVAHIDTITTLNGINNIYADAGNVSVSAYDSIQHYIDTRL